MSHVNEKASLSDRIFGIVLAALIFGVFAIIFYNGWPTFVKTSALGAEGMGL